MVIDVEHEHLLSSKEACKEFPGGRRISLAKLNRLWFRGIGGKKLESVRICGRRYTSREAILRFIASQNDGGAPPPAITPTQRHRLARAAQALLAELGIGR